MENGFPVTSEPQAMRPKVMVSIYDEVAQVFGGPWTALTPAEACRQFVASVRNPQNGMLHTNPEDYRLMVVAEWHEESGQVVAPTDGPRALMRGEAALPPSENPALQPVKE